MTKKIIALTGGIGSGKSLAAQMFKELGACVVDTDRIARDIVKPGEPAYAAILEHFGPSILRADRTIDRAALRKIVFNNPDDKKILENITHPLIRNAAKHAMDSCNAPYCIMVIPLWVESANSADAYDFVTRVLVIDCDEAIQRERAAQRDQLPEAEIDRIIKQQSSRQARLAVADDVIENSGNQAFLAEQVKALHERYAKC